MDHGAHATTVQNNQNGGGSCGAQAATTVQNNQNGASCGMHATTVQNNQDGGGLDGWGWVYSPAVGHWESYTVVEKDAQLDAQPDLPRRSTRRSASMGSRLDAQLDAQPDRSTRRSARSLQLDARLDFQPDAQLDVQPDAQLEEAQDVWRVDNLFIF